MLVQNHIRGDFLIFKTLLKALLIVLPTASIAHSPLSSSSPQDGETLIVSPTEIVLQYESPAKLIKVDLRKQSSTQDRSLFGEILGRNNGESVPLGTAFLLTIDKRQSIPLPALEDGSYSFSWRAMGEDGHVIKGNFTFNIKVN